MISKKHWFQMAKTLIKYREDDFMCDTILVTRTGQIKAHGILLAAVSPVCKTAFEDNWGQGVHYLEFPEMDASTLEVIVNYAYTGKLVLPLKQSQKHELSKMLTSLQSLGVDIHRLNGSEIKFTGDSTLNGSCEAELYCSEDSTSELPGSVTSSDGLKPKEEEESKQDTKETIFISVSEAPDSAPFESAEANQDKEGWTGGTQAHDYALEDQGQQHIILQCGPDIDAQQYEVIQNLLMSADAADNSGDNCVVTEHSYYNYEVSNQKVGDFGSISIKVEEENGDYAGEETGAKHRTDPRGDGQKVTQHKCPFCTKFFDAAEKLDSHLATVHSNAKVYECVICQKKLSSELNLSLHMNSAHSGSKPFLCDLCGQAFAQNSLLTSHIESHHKAKLIYMCGLCSSPFATQNKMRLHMSITHKISSADLDMSKLQDVQETSECIEAANEPADSDENRPYLCDVCGRNFKTAWSLKNHEKIHAGVDTPKMYPCSLCSKSFVHKSQVAQHMVKHTGLKPFTCNICDKSYSQKGSLTQHQRTHSGEKPFVCQTCGKAFVIKAMLLQHLRVHTGEKPHVCQICGKAFIYKESLVVHMRIHTGEKPYRCKICGNSYTQSHHLKGHMLTHTGEKPFTCSFCDKAYKNRVDLRFHCQRVHHVNISKRPTVAGANVKPQPEQQ